MRMRRRQSRTAQRMRSWGERLTLHLMLTLSVPQQTDQQARLHDVRALPPQRFRL